MTHDQNDSLVCLQREGVENYAAPEPVVMNVDYFVHVWVAVADSAHVEVDGKTWMPWAACLWSQMLVCMVVAGMVMKLGRVMKGR